MIFVLVMFGRAGLGALFGLIDEGAYVRVG